MTSCGCCEFQDTAVLTNTCGAGAALFMTLVEIVLQSQCSIVEPCQRIVSTEQPAPEYDFIVVGAGVSGSVVASRLSEVQDWTVLLLEAGIDEPTAGEVPAFVGKLQNTRFDWNYTTVPQENACLNKGGVCGWPRGKVMGGTGVLQGMMYMRGNPKDYDRWVEDGNEGWGYDDVFPYFLKSEDNGNMDIVDEGYHSVGGYLPVEQYTHQPDIALSILEAGKELGYRVGDLNGRNQTGFAIAQMTSRNGIRYSPPKAFLRPVRNRTNLHVVIDALATKIIIDPETKTATGVQYLKDGEYTTVNIRKEVIVSGGAINSPQLLLLSGIGPQEHLEDVGVEVIQNLPVGHNLHNHVAMSVSFTINETDYRILTTETLNQYITNHTGPLASTGLNQMTGLVTSKYAEKDYPDLQLFFRGYSSGCSFTGLQTECSDGSTEVCEKRRGFTISPTLVHPKSRGVLQLKSSDPLDPPLMDPKYLTDESDVLVLVDGARIAIELSQTKAFQAWDMQLDTNPISGCEAMEFATDEYWKCVITRNTGAENHQSGSVKLGPLTDPDAVLDAQLRVHGMPNIRVMDASIYPRMVTGNPIASLFMIGEKGSDMVKKAWGVE